MNEFELEVNEKISKSVRKHWIVLGGSLFSYIVLSIIPLLSPIAFSALSLVSPNSATALGMSIAPYAPWLQLVLGIYWLFIWCCMLNTFTRYYLTQWIITTTRIIYIHQFGFFSRQVSSFLLNRVQDVTTDVNGPIQTLFGFGTLDVETAGREDHFQIDGIDHPAELRDLIMREIAELHADGLGQSQQVQSGV